jgi:hypothetical protein
MHVCVVTFEALLGYLVLASLSRERRVFVQASYPSIMYKYISRCWEACLTVKCSSEQKLLLHDASIQRYSWRRAVACTVQIW